MENAAYINNENQLSIAQVLGRSNGEDPYAYSQESLAAEKALNTPDPLQARSVPAVYLQTGSTLRSRNSAFLYEENGSTKKAVAGIVQRVNFYMHNEARRCAVELKDLTGGVWTVFFHDRPDEPDRPQMAARVEKARVSAGSRLLIVGYFDTQRRTANGLAFEYRGR